MTRNVDKSGVQAPADPLAVYRSRRSFPATPEPAATASSRRHDAPVFVVQEHHARRLHWDFRLEHDGVLWSWAVPKGPSMDPGDKRLAVRTEDHPLAYAEFSGTIPQGQYGAGEVALWDGGAWQSLGDAAEQVRAGELKFSLHGTRLHGRFVLIRMKPRGRERADNWLLIKERDERPVEPPPAAVRGALPRRQAPQLAQAVEQPPRDGDWLSEVKFDGYRLLIFRNGARVKLQTRGGEDWTRRLPGIAAAAARLPLEVGLLDGELVAPRPDGLTDFRALQQALADSDDSGLAYYAFDLLHQDGWDLRPCRLTDRKAALARLIPAPGVLRYSDHMVGISPRILEQACGMGMEGLICKRADAPYRPGRGPGWCKLKCLGREEFIVLGWTRPAGSRAALGALVMGYRDADGTPHFAGSVGTGFSDPALRELRRRLEPLAAPAPEGLRYADPPPDRGIAWVRPELVAEVQYAGWSGAGRLRHATYLGLRADKPAEAVVRPVADPQAPRHTLGARPKPATIIRSTGSDAVTLTHPDRELWPGVSKRALADYWEAVANHALPEIVGRPLALVRCPDGIAGEHFFQKHAGRGWPAAIRAGTADSAPYLVIDDQAGLAAAAQMAALELHAWGAREPDALHPDRLVLDLDPDEGLPFDRVITAAKEVRERLQALGLAAFCRTTGGKGLHVVVPLRPLADWDAVRAFSRAFAERMVADAPERYVAKLAKPARHGRVLLDWLRNGLGATAVASFSPRARPGAPVATNLAWREVTNRLDPSSFTIATVPARLKRQRRDPWDGFSDCDQTLPEHV